MTSQNQAPANLIHNGEYSDFRFIDMMAAHHSMAISMAEVAVDKGEHQELVKFAKSMIEDQKKEIEKLQSILDDIDGSKKVATEPHPHERSMHGMDSSSELAQKTPFDRAFIVRNCLITPLLSKWRQWRLSKAQMKISRPWRGRSLTLSAKRSVR